MEDIITRLMPMEPSIKAVTVKDSNDDYNVYLNANISPTERFSAFMHEVSHISKGHFFSDKSVREKEAAV